ncbi:hypothetical protein Q3G72_000959 [Acer saccharum]|nr:hypothetical protein Q3G72_000959 [Acer saccharum]
MLGHVVRGCPEICKQENVVVSDFHFRRLGNLLEEVRLYKQRLTVDSGGLQKKSGMVHDPVESDRFRAGGFMGDNSAVKGGKSGKNIGNLNLNSKVGNTFGTSVNVRAEKPGIREETIAIVKRHPVNLRVDGLGPMVINEDGLNSIQTFAGGIITEMKRVIGPSGVVKEYKEGDRVGDPQLGNNPNMGLSGSTYLGLVQLGELDFRGVHDPLSGRGSVLMIDKDEAWKSNLVSVKKVGQWKKAATNKAASKSEVSPVLSSGKRKETVSADVFTEGTKRSKSDVSETVTKSLSAGQSPLARRSQ